MNGITILQLPDRGTDRDFEALRTRHPELGVTWVRPEDYIEGSAKILVLPGSGKTMSDLVALRAAGGDQIIKRHLELGGTVLGICGGMQILGEWLFDPHQHQGEAGEVLQGLGYLPLITCFGPVMAEADGNPFKPNLFCYTTAEFLVGDEPDSRIYGIENRTGISYLTKRAIGVRPLHQVVTREFIEPQPPRLQVETIFSTIDWQPGTETLDGIVKGKVVGTYFHMILSNENFVRWLLKLSQS